MKRTYLDYASTTPVDPQVLEVMRPYFSERFGNPSSAHHFGQEAKKALEDARAHIASLLGAKEEEIVFTSGGTEANNFAIFGVVRALPEKGRHIVTTAIEHHAVLEPLHQLEREGWQVTLVKPDKDGIVSCDDIASGLTPKTVLVSVMHANNEIGSIQPVKDIARLCRSRGITFHTDAVQTVGHIPVDVEDLGVDLLSLSAHKFYGPKGAGCLYIRRGVRIAPYLLGGSQERQRRASTENVPAIVGLGEAAKIAAEKVAEEFKQQSRWRDTLIAEIPRRVRGAYLNGSPSQRIPHNVNFSFDGAAGEALVLHLDMLGIACSTGSACMSRTLEPSHVLTAIGRAPELARASLRVSFGRFSAPEDFRRLLEALPEALEKLRAASPVSSGKISKRP